MASKPPVVLPSSASADLRETFVSLWDHRTPPVWAAFSFFCGLPVFPAGRREQEDKSAGSLSIQDRLPFFMQTRGRHFSTENRYPVVCRKVSPARSTVVGNWGKLGLQG